ncbi:ion channel [Rubrivirga sp.]|uniref:ion channel n=1 Tax=Rubrivirga sp. TaxID=1885344 RepID=UPI003C76C597
MSARLIAFLLFTSATALAQPADLTVAVAEAPPVVTKSGELWDGLGPALVEDMGQEGRRIQFVEVSRDSLIDAVVSGRADAAIAPVSATDEETVNFVAPFYATPLGIARAESSVMLDVARNLLTPMFFKVVAGLIGLLFVVGVVIWLIERRTDQDDFREGWAGMWDGFWWSGVTMTTIGYGDTVPKTPGGRSIALLWMLVSMGVTAALTTALISALDLESGNDARLNDLEGQVGAIEGSIELDMLREMDVTAVPFSDLEDGLEAISGDSLDAFIGPAPDLRASAPDGIEVASTTVAFDRWGLAVAEGSPLQEEVSRAVIDRIMSPDWPETVRRHTEE